VSAGSVPAALLALAGGVALAVALARLLRGRRYRYEDELDLPLIPIGWAPLLVVPAVAVLGWRWSAEPGLAVVLGVAAAWMVGLAAIDVDVRRLPDRWTFPGAAAAVLALGALGIATGDVHRWWWALAAGVGSGLVYLVLALINPAGLGLGDVKLAVPLGLLTGWFGWSASFAAFVLAFVIGAVVGLAVTLVRRQRAFPFGPSMVVGAWLVLLFAPY
jgi:leader peptidase (prepilin peptidase)/N-methyltransferase